MLKSTPQIYGKVARFLHWASAILILIMFPIGLTMANMADTSLKTLLYLIHVNLGFLVLILTAIRVVWRFIEPTPSIPDNLPPARQWLFKAIHLGQYVVLIGLTLTGTGTFIAAGPLTDQLPETIATILPAAHSLLSKVFMGLLLAHLVGLFEYQFTKGDVLTRMGFPKNLVNALAKSRK